MPGTAEINGAFRPVNEHDAIPAFLNRPLAANEQIGRGQFATVDLATGFAALNDGTVPGQASAGVGDPSTLSDVSTFAGSARVRLSQRHMKSIPASTLGGDSFAESDFGKAFWIADENTPGKLTNQGGNNRSLGGLVFGLDTDGEPILWTGPVAWLLARWAHQADRAALGSYQHIGDTLAADTQAETIINRPFLAHGVIDSVRFVPTAALTANDTNNALITISKRDGAGGAAVVVATILTDVASGSWVAFTPKDMVLSVVAGALNILETDVLTLTVAKNGSGVALPAGTIEIRGKVI